MGDILEQISANYQTFAPRQRKVAEYLFHNLDQAILLNSTQIAAKAEVSQATVTRFITALGFSGFSKFKRSVAQKLLEDSSTSTRLVESAKTLKGRTSVFTDILRGDVENIGALSSQIPEEIFEEAVNRLCSARTIYILGLRSSFALAFYLAFDLRFFLSSVKLIDLGVGDIPERLRNAGPPDVLVVISFKRYTRETVKITEKVKKKGVFVLGITNSELSPIAQMSDRVLIAETRIPAYFESFTAPMSLLNALITAIAIKERKTALPVLNDLEKEFQVFETFEQ
jgi:DNA-binding MurR/RpiR family transcriptional regulator